MHALNVLILGGTSEASALARLLAGDPRFAATLSLAGVTRKPLAQPVAVRTGGFGGVEGLVRHLEDSAVEVLVDATHPFAARISANAAEAARRSGVQLLAIRRPQWEPQAGDRWTVVPDMAGAAAALGDDPRRVFLAVGRKDLAPFRAFDRHHYVVRSVDPPSEDALPAGSVVMTARGPFTETGERDLLEAHRIDMLVTKNSGGAATEAKLAAARKLGIPVVMVARPSLPGTESVATPEAAFTWLEHRHQAASGAPRGV